MVCQAAENNYPLSGQQLFKRPDYCTVADKQLDRRPENKNNFTGCRRPPAGARLLRQTWTAGPFSRRLAGGFSLQEICPKRVKWAVVILRRRRRDQRTPSTRLTAAWTFPISMIAAGLSRTQACRCRYKILCAMRIWPIGLRTCGFALPWS